MSLLETIVNIQITRETTAIERAGFGKMLVMGAHRAWSNRIRFYGNADELLDDGFHEADAEYRAAVTYFSQNPKPTEIAVGRILTTNTVVVVIDVISNSTMYTVFLDGVGFDFTSDATATSTEIEAGLTTAINTGYAITAVSTVNETFTIAGDHAASFPAGKQFRVTGSTGNDGTYTIVSAVFGTDTVITVEEDVTSAVADGFIKSATVVTAVNSVAGDGLVSLTCVTATLVGVDSKMHLTFTNNETMAAAIDAIEEEDADWYGVMLASRVEADVLAVSAAVETRRKLFLASSDDTDIINLSDSGDAVSLAAQFKALNRARSGLIYSGMADGDLTTADGDPFPEAALFGKRLPTDPGSETWAYAQLSGIIADNLTATQRGNVWAKNANTYETVAGVDVLLFGTTAEPEYMDVIRFVDFLHARMTEAIFSRLVNSLKIPYTDAGIAVIEGEVRKVLQNGIDAGGLASITSVMVPKAADVDPQDKIDRILRNVEFRAVLAGAIHKIEVQGVVTV